MNGAQRRLFESLGGTPVRVGTGRHKKVLISADRRYPKRPRWDVLKRDVMAIALRAKFDRHPSLWRGHLESDPFTFFIEHTVNDAQWGDGGLGHGTNLLGKMLTALNHELRSGTTIDRHAAAYDAWLSQPNIDVLRGFYD